MVNIDVKPQSDVVPEEVFFGDDGPYEFIPPKAGRLLNTIRKMQGTGDKGNVILFNAQIDWLERGFHPDDWDYFLSRIEDEDDALDWGHMLSAAQELFGQASGGRPTTSPNGSLPRPQPRKRTAEPLNQESDSLTSLS